MVCFYLKISKTELNSMRKIFLKSIFFFCLALPSYGQEKIDGSDDYVINKKNMQSEFKLITIDPKGINPLFGNVGKLENIKVTVGNYMTLWVFPKEEHKKSSITWDIYAPKAGTYDVSASVEAWGANYTLLCNDKTVKTIAEPYGGFKIVEFGKLDLVKGKNTLVIEMTNTLKKQRFSHLTIVEENYHTKVLARALESRVQEEWFKNAGYGLMFQWTNRATPPMGKVKAWEQKVNDFKLDAFLEAVESSGAKYVVWSITWGEQYISAPIKSLDKILTGRTTTRDLLGEMADALHQRGVKLIFYYHYGYDCMHSTDAEWMKAVGGYKADKTMLYDNWMNIIAEIGKRYGDKLNGWWFDGGARYLNCHFDGSPADKGIITAPFEQMTKVARTGNPKRMVAYNSWIKPRITEFQDYYGGEGSSSFNGRTLDNGVFISGKQQGLQAHGCFIFEKHWGRLEHDTPIPESKRSVEWLEQIVTKARTNKTPISINLEMYEDGTISPHTLSLLKEFNKRVN